MPQDADKKRSHKPVKNSTAPRGRRQQVMARRQTLSRPIALKQVKKLLSQTNAIPPEAVELISLFRLQIDELTEAGVPYEMVRALEKRYALLLFQD
jgi:hypothetical protein